MKKNSIADVTRVNNDLLEVLRHIARGACLDQINQDHCICYSCIAKVAIAKATEIG